MDPSSITQRIANLSPVKRALLEQRLRQDGQESPALRTIQRCGARDFAPLSFAQQRLWFLNQLEPDICTYNETSALRLDGELNINALHGALNAIVERHEVLRTTYAIAEDGAPVQIVNIVAAIDFPVLDISELTASQQDAEVQRVASELKSRPFDLSNDLPLRLALIRLSPSSHVVVTVKHHIASDGWSSGVFSRELTTLYHRFNQGETTPLPELPIQYADYAVWQREWLQGEVLDRQLSYWKDQLRNVPTLELATDRSRAASRRNQAGRKFVMLPSVLTDQLKALSKGEGATLFMTLLAAFQILLQRYTGQDDIAVGSPIAGRTRSELEGLIGFFVNTLVYRNNLSGDPSFRKFLANVRDGALNAYEHQDLPFEKLVEELNPERSLTHSPVFQVLFAVQNVPRQKLEIPGLTATPLEIESTTAKFDLFAAFVERDRQLVLRMEYNADLFNADTIERMAGHFLTLLEGIAANPERRISELPLLTEAEKHQVLVEWNETKRDYPKDKCIHQLFEEQVERTPEAVAVVFKDRQLTYRELNTRANQLAHQLMKLGVGSDVLVGICVERSIEMIVGLLGILKAGGAYVPLDPAYPKDRIAYILKDAQALILLTEECLLEDLEFKCVESTANQVGRSDSGFSDLDSHLRAICLDRDWEEFSRENRQNLPNQATPANLAYVIYTSGSTGIPKGVMIEHRNAVAFLSWAASVFTHEELAGVIASTSICFDLSIFELFAPLTSGGRVILLENALALSDLDPALEPTLINTVPSVMIELLRHSEFPASIRTVNLAGEPLKTNLVEEIHERTSAARVYDLYGPSETTTYSTYVRRTIAGLQTIGRPIGNTQVYILDPYLNPVPTGIVGEIYIGGDGLSRGYLNQPKLTAEKFMTHSLDGESAKRLYKTGDLARYLPDGNIEFLGRIDNQVKLRGYRIELGEIEAVLGQHPMVQSSVVVVREDTPRDKRLVAYVVGRQGESFDAAELRKYLKQKLPEYMIPSAFVRLDELPLTPNGKIDRKALPEPDQDRPELGNIYQAPRTPIEESIAAVWAEVLKVDKIGIHDNFFELGGHSLLATRVISRLRDVFQVDLPLRCLFETPTIFGLAQRAQELGEKRETRSEKRIAPAVRERYRVQSRIPEKR
jgi:amino acid adenylation domain-containing protein